VTLVSCWLKLLNALNGLSWFLVQGLSRRTANFVLDGGPNALTERETSPEEEVWSGSPPGSLPCEGYSDSGYVSLQSI